MKWLRTLFLFFLIPALVYGFDETEAKQLRDQASSEWKRHNELIEDYKNFCADVEGHGLHRIREALYCCQRALSLTDNILNDIASKSKKNQKRQRYTQLKKACQQDRETLIQEIAALEKGIDDILSSMALKKQRLFMKRV